MNIQPTTDTAIAEAARCIRVGGVVVFPTDTVYGLACDLFNAEAVERIYRVKGRPAKMPLIAMLTPGGAGEVPADLEHLVTTIPESARRFMARCWPGPLTIIMPACPELPATVLGGGETIGVRVPDHADALRLLRAAGISLATTSANLSGHPAALTAAEAAEQVGDMVDLIFDAGPCPGGIASTVVNCAVEPPVILREGPVTAAMLEEIYPEMGV